LLFEFILLRLSPSSFPLSTAANHCLAHLLTYPRRLLHFLIPSPLFQSPRFHSWESGFVRGGRSVLGWLLWTHLEAIVLAGFIWGIFYLKIYAVNHSLWFECSFNSCPWNFYGVLY
jgi:hypothetical protein